MSADLVAEVLRIHDLLVAGGGPRTVDDWDLVVLALQSAHERAQKERAAAPVAPPIPMPAMESDGKGARCCERCPLLLNDEWCTHGGAMRYTRINTACRPWFAAAPTPEEVQVPNAAQAPAKRCSCGGEMAPSRADGITCGTCGRWHRVKAVAP